MFVKQAKQAVQAIIVAIATIAITLGQPAMADTVRMDHGPFATMLNLPVYQWQDNGHAPRAVVLAIHGLTMHGTVFDACARKLAADGAIVVAPDLRGYGAWYTGSKKTHVNYAQSEKDVCALAAALRKRYKGLPVFLSGESLGGSMAILIAAKHAELIDGLILSAPAIKYYHSVPARTLMDAAFALAAPGYQVDISEYIKKDFSEDSLITEEELSDPLIRKRLSMSDLVESCRLINSTRRYIGKIRSGTPVLVLQGERDRMVKPSGVTVLESSLKTSDKTVQLYPLRGHILMETQHVREDVIKTIISWIDSQCVLYSLQHATIAAGKSASHPGG